MMVLNCYQLQPFLFGRLQARRSEPIAHTGGRFSLSGAPEKQLALQTRPRSLGGLTKAFGFLCEPLFECIGVFDTASSLRHSAPPLRIVIAEIVRCWRREYQRYV